MQRHCITSKSLKMFFLYNIYLHDNFENNITTKISVSESLPDLMKEKLALKLNMAHVLHDFLLVKGGAERLVLTLAEGIGAPLISGFRSEATRGWNTSVEVRALGPYLSGRLARYVATAHRFSRLSPEQLSSSANIYSGVLAPFAVKNQTEGRRIHYCHSPPRFFYDLKGFYQNRTGMVGRAGLNLLGAWFRPRYEESIRAMDVVIANSHNVARRLKHYIGVESTVIHPPIDTSRFRWIEQDDYYLSLARLEDYKRVETIIEAFRRLPAQKLVIASGGSMEPGLRRFAADCRNITFTSWLDDARLADLIGRCRAAIYIPRDEDFGMSPLEAMAAGKPVIGVREGGLIETIEEGITGFLLEPDPAVEELVVAVENLDRQLALDMRRACETRAKEFSQDVFLDRMRQEIGRP